MSTALVASREIKRSNPRFRNISRRRADEALGIGDNLKRARKNAGMTQEAVAEVIKRPATSLSDWERGPARGGRIPHVRILLKLSEVYRISLDELVTGKQPPLPVNMPSEDEWTGIRSLLRNAKRVLSEEGDPAKREARVSAIVEAAEILTDA
jgi:transcriptional regulator with XRE-family HTH domain